MKYIAFLEADPADMDKIVKRQKALRKQREETGEFRKGWKSILNAHQMSTGKAILICEADEEGIQQYYLDWSPLIKAKFVPIIPMSQLVEAMEKT